MTPCGWNRHHRLAGWAKIDPDKLFADFIALVPLIRDARKKAPASTGDLEQRAMVIMGQISTAPPPLLKQAFEKLVSSALPDDIKNETSVSLLIRLAETDPAWAVAQNVKMAGHPHILRSILKVWTTKVTAAATAWIETAVKDGSLAGYDTGPVRYDDDGLVKSLKRGPKQTTTEPPPGCVISLPAPTTTPPWAPSPLSSPKKNPHPL